MSGPTDTPRPVEPATAAGRALLDEIYRHDQGRGQGHAISNVRVKVLAVEQEARSALEQRVRELESALRALWWSDGKPTSVEGPDGNFHDLRFLRRRADGPVVGS